MVVVFLGSVFGFHECGYVPIPFNAPCDNISLVAGFDLRSDPLCAVSYHDQSGQPFFGDCSDLEEDDCSALFIFLALFASQQCDFDPSLTTVETRGVLLRFGSVVPTYEESDVYNCG